MSDSIPPSEDAASETPAQHIAAEQKKKNFYRRITSSMPLLITVIVHVVLIVGAAAVVVQQSGGAKKKTFEASNQSENANKQVEHRLQVARRGGASSASQSPVAANRIFSTSENALQMPAMPDLPSMGAGGFGGFGGMGSGVGMGAGSGMSTSLGGGSGLGGRDQAVGKGEKRFRNDDRAVQIEPGLAGLPHGDARTVHPRHLARPDTQRALAPAIDDGV